MRGLLLVGSHNLTAGGVYYNYEAGLRCELNLNDEADLRLEYDVQSYLDRLISDGSVCKRLDARLLESLVDDPTYRIGDENANRRGPSPAEGQEPYAPEDTDTVTEDQTERVPIFGRSGTRKRPGPTIGSLARTLAKRPVPRPNLGGSFPPTPPGAPVVKRWWKKMSASDAQKPPNPNSQVTGNLRLSQARHPIDHKIYFREEFFMDAHWIQADPNDPTYEMCYVEMDVTLGGDHLGMNAFRIDYKPSRIAAQNNVPTVLKWGACLAIDYAMKIMHRNMLCLSGFGMTRQGLQYKPRNRSQSSLRILAQCSFQALSQGADADQLPLLVPRFPSDPSVDSTPPHGLCGTRQAFVHGIFNLIVPLDRTVARISGCTEEESLSARRGSCRPAEGASLPR